jgi:hemoglobin
LENLRDIETREDLQFIVRSFYDKLLVDEEVKHFFEHIHPDDLPHHLERVVDFWFQILFGGDGYSGNPMKPHFILHKKHPFERRHFDRWLELFRESVEKNFKGNNAEEIISRSVTIARVMELKLP